MTQNSIQFLMNDQLTQIVDLDPNMTVLHYLREHQLKPGTKEGCGSGDCGACTVVTVELSGKNNESLAYKSINACITFVGNLHGKQLVTIEHLKQLKDNTKSQLHPVQKHMVENHASQCGFCTPGIVMSCFALHKKNQNPDRTEVMTALAGNLCRCTGYRSIIDAAMQSTDAFEADISSDKTKQIIRQLQTIQTQSFLQFRFAGKTYVSPKNTRELSAYLLANPSSTLVSGGTDLALMVTQDLAEFTQLVSLENVCELNNISKNSETITIGSAVTYSDFGPVLSKYYPELGEMIERIGSTQIRNTGTLGGNIGNASPIGDMPPALIALGAKINLQRGNDTREISLENYFTGYKQTLLKEAEFIKEIVIPKPKPNQILKVYKISKRFDDDISAVLVACLLELENNNVKRVRVAFGGMAATPMRAKNCELTLAGKPFVQDSINLAKQALETDFSPMSDVRASAKYRMKVAQNIIQRFYLEISSDAGLSRVVNHA